MAVAGTGAAVAQSSENPVVVELYTSQGCSSCPPADEFLHELAKRDDIIALALHVDYWDYIGWKDSFASPDYTARQKGYARAMGERTIYTPQMIIAGQDHVVGNKPMRVADLVREHGARDHGVDLRVGRDGGALSVAARAGQRFDRPAVVQLVRYQTARTVSISRGENAGRTITYANVVEEWRVLGEWDGARPLQISEQVNGDHPAVVIIQHKGHGAILAAARLR